MTDDRETITTISPSTNQPILTRHGLSEEEATQMIRRAREAFVKTSGYPFPHPGALQKMNNAELNLSLRQKIVSKALDLMEERQQELGRELTEQMGRPIAYVTKEITTAVARGRYLLEISQDALQDTPGEPESGYRRYIRKEPVGVVLIIFAWNYPYLILVNSLIPAILAGNVVILKPSPQTPTIAEHVQRIFLDAGLPENVIQYFHCGSPERLETVIRSPEVDLISFTGSVVGGLSVQRAASARVIPVCLELGGKDAAYVRGDVDIRWAAEEVIDGALFNSGQSCCSIERVYVDEKIYDEFISAAQEVLKGYRLGDPFDQTTQLGPVISKKSVETIRQHIGEAIEQGAIDVTPENESFQSPPPNGNYVAPTLLINVQQKMRVMSEETFGPVIPVMKVRNDAEAIQLMNDSEFGLTASIWTRDRAMGEELAKYVESGTVFVNRCDFPSPVSLHE
ncbi:MAG: hypothetical protein M1823_005095 [Watsoniomyces obsoletus]|nr:MAG: hypothetical protein M1823_005095 [Watsoniomyces obsoletus]